MNVLQAMDKLDTLNEQIRALDIAIDQLEFRKEYNHEARLLEGILVDIQKKADEIKTQLEKTQLVNLPNKRQLNE